MVRKSILAAALIAPAFMLMACEQSEPAPETDLPPAEEVTPTPEEDTTAGMEGEGTAALSVATAEGVGSYIADAQGRALYMLEADSAGESTCVDECAEAWPPFTVDMGQPTVSGTELDSALLGVFERPDGLRQVTYNGHPLYYYREDMGPGDINGQDVTDEWGEWYLVAPSGEPIEGSQESQDTTSR